VTETVDAGSHLRSRVLYDVEATMSVPAYLLVPKERVDAPSGSAVLAVHGHGPGKEMICGLTGPDHEHYARQLVELGHVVLAPDLRCFGERQDPQWSPEAHKYDCDWNLVAATMAGRVPLAQNLWDLHRGIDVLAEHPLVDAARIAVAGLSYGATMSLFLAATDQRIAAAIVSGYLSSWRAAHSVPWNMCGSQVLPGQLGVIEHIDVAALVAPRPLLVESGTDDPLFPVGAAQSTVAQLRRVYEALGADPDRVVHDVFEGDHRWHGDDVGAFLQRAVGDRRRFAGSEDEQTVTSPE
jgi:dienelactone hydrolase